MRALLYDIVLSFCPASFRRSHLPRSSRRVLFAAIVTGVLQAVACAYGVFSGFKALLLLRTSQYGQILERSNQTTQNWFAIVLFFEYIVFHPWGLFLLYMAFEGCVRFVAGTCVSEVVASLPVVVSIRLLGYFRARKAERALAPLAAIPDSLEVLGDNRLRIASALPKTRWKQNFSVRIAEDWYEVESAEQGDAPRFHIYVLRPLPIGKVVRAREDYDISATVTAKAADGK